MTHARILLALITFALVALAFAGSAEARGNVIVRNPVMDEKDGEWKMKLKVDYGSTPHIPHIPMVFTFKPVAIYERQLTDDSPDKPVERRVSLQGQTDINVPMDVGFADA